MINREWTNATILSYTQNKDAYGQRTISNQSRDIEIVLRLYQHNMVSDIRYNDATHLALTADKQVNDSDEVVVDGKTYKVIYVIPSPRLNTLIMKVI